MSVYSDALRLIIGFMALVLVGCSSSPAPTVIDKQFKFRLLLVEQTVYKGKQVEAFAVWDAETCIIILKKSEYPRCLLHEMRHCIEHHWHKNKVTTEDC